MPWSEQSFLLVALMACLYAWPGLVLGPPLAPAVCPAKVWLAELMMSRGKMLPKGPMSG